jgi:polyisoprenoid-binding protein YceI
MSCRKALVRLLQPLLALFVTAAAGAATIDPPLRYVVDASASNVSATVPFFDLASKTARFPRTHGMVTIAPGAPEKALIDVTFDATAIEAPGPITKRQPSGKKFFQLTCPHRFRGNYPFPHPFV